MTDLFSDLSATADPETSHLAAQEVVASGTVERQANLVLTIVQNNPGLTSDEVGQIAYQITANPAHDRYMAARRLAGLMKVGMVRQGERRQSRVGGRLGVTWYATQGETNGV